MLAVIYFKNSVPSCCVTLLHVLPSSSIGGSSQTHMRLGDYVNEVPQWFLNVDTSYHCYAISYRSLFWYLRIAQGQPFLIRPSVSLMHWLILGLIRKVASLIMPICLNKGQEEMKIDRKKQEMNQQNKEKVTRHCCRCKVLVNFH